MSEAIETVRAFLSHLENRDLEAAKDLTGPGFSMTFPGGHCFTSFEDLIAWAKPRYQWVKKHHDRFDTGTADDGTVVTCFGTLYGVLPDGTEFADVRYADWFLLRDGKIVDQRVWNDLAEFLSQNQ